MGNLIRHQDKYQSEVKKVADKIILHVYVPVRETKQIGTSPGSDPTICMVGMLISDPNDALAKACKGNNITVDRWTKEVIISKDPNGFNTVKFTT